MHGLVQRPVQRPVHRLVRRVLNGVALAALLLVGLGLVLPRRWEVRREARYRVSPEVLLATLDDLSRVPQRAVPRWVAWEPGRRGALTVTASNVRGRWYDVAGQRRRRAALLVAATPDGAHLTWLDVLHTGFDPIAQVLALGRGRRVGAQLERSLLGLRGVLEPP